MDSSFHRQLKLEDHEKQELAKIWAYVGRFMWSFAQIESRVDELILVLFGVDAFVWGLIISTLDLRKKLNFLALGFKHKKNDQDTPLKKLHQLHDIRNMLTHCRFIPDYGNNEHKEGSGIEFEYFAPHAKDNIPRFASHGSKFSSFIAYSQFDLYDEQMSSISGVFDNLLKSTTPISDINEDMVRDIEVLVERSENVIRFPKRET
jgi:hypothetical protein